MPRRGASAPTSEVDAERSVLELLVSSPWKDFGATLSRWVGTLPPPVARRVALVAGGLAVRELLRRLVAHEPRAFEPAALLADLVRALAAPVELEGEVVLAMRALGATAAGEVVSDLAQARDLTRLAGAAVLYPAHRAWVTDALLRMRVAREASPPVVALLEVLVLSALAGVVSVYVLLRRLAFAGDAMTHTIFPGVAIAFVAGQSLFLGALAAGLASAVVSCPRP